MDRTDSHSHRHPPFLIFLSKSNLNSHYKIIMEGYLKTKGGEVLSSPFRSALAFLSLRTNYFDSRWRAFLPSRKAFRFSSWILGGRCWRRFFSHASSLTSKKFEKAPKATTLTALASPHRVAISSPLMGKTFPSKNLLKVFTTPSGYFILPRFTAGGYTSCSFRITLPSSLTQLMYRSPSKSSKDTR